MAPSSGGRGDSGRALLNRRVERLHERLPDAAYGGGVMPRVGPARGV